MIFVQLIEREKQKKQCNSINYAIPWACEAIDSLIHESVAPFAVAPHTSGYNSDGNTDIATNNDNNDNNNKKIIITLIGTHHQLIACNSIF